MVAGEIETHKHTLCLQDPARSMVAGQRHTNTHSAYKTRTEHGRWSEIHKTHTLLTRPARSMVAGQRHTNTHSAYKTRTLVRDTLTHTLPACKTRTGHGRWSEDTSTHSDANTHVHCIVTGQIHTLPARSMHGRWSETHKHTICL